MAYCPKCGTKNDDDAAFCKKCGAPQPPAKAGEPVGEEPGMYPPGYELDRRGKPGYAPPPKPPHRKDFDKECEEECQGSGGTGGWFWALIIILIGVFIIFEAGIKNIDGMPGWVYDVDLWWLIPTLIGVMIIVAGVRVLSRRT